MASKLFEPNALVVPFEDLRMTDVDSVGGKNASLGEMISQLPQGVRVPTGFATTAYAFREFLKYQDLDNRIHNILEHLDADDLRALAIAGSEIRHMVVQQPFPIELENAIRTEFIKLSAGNPKLSFAVRSSATAEDLPDASFAGQQESFLNVSDIDEILQKIREVFASLYNDRAISYRVHKGFIHSEVAISAGIQRMVRSDIGASGVMFTMDTESGFKDVVFITANYGLGETVVQGAVNPDEYYVFKPTLAQGKNAIIRRNMGSKLIRMVFSTPGQKMLTGKPVYVENTPVELSYKYALSDSDIEQLANYAVIIEKHYGRPMDIEWGKDGIDGLLYILQARPETVKSQQNGKTEQRFKLKEKGTAILEGRAIGQKIGSGRARIVHSLSEMDKISTGDVLVTDMTDPNWEPIMKKAAAIVTNRGGRTCHAAIIARELGIPAIVGCGKATSIIQENQNITVSCAEGDTGYVYDHILPFDVTEVERKELPPVDVKIMMNVGNPQLAFDFSQIPNGGVGLARLEFIINNNIGVHPKVILAYPNLSDELKATVEQITRGHASPRDFYIDKIAEGVATIAASFYPKPVIVRLSDFKSNEYRKLLGGELYEPEEENPMLGFRGAARYISQDFQDAFILECIALKRVREEMGLDNVEIMIPFVRTLKQAEKVINLLASQGLKRGENGLKIIMMCEVPSNAVLAEEFLEYFDGFSIGSNDLTQLTLGLDRDSGLELLAADFDERDQAIKTLLKKVIMTCKEKGKYVGICGQGPSDHPDFADWLVQEDIVSISLNPDTVINTWKRIAKTN
ncbi:MAG: phosphoenolpyruvate synthase [Commensalibacter sp.]|nr:phosphoenolpyruvate synthase [Commensalibacter sp.]